MRAHHLYILFVQSVHGLSWKLNTEHRAVHQKICRWLRVHVLRERDTYSSNAGPWKRSSSNGTDIEKWGGIKQGAPCGSYGVADVAGTKGRPALFLIFARGFPIVVSAVISQWRRCSKVAHVSEPHERPMHRCLPHLLPTMTVPVVPQTC